MVDRTDPADPLLPLGLRDLIETSVNGLLCAAVPDHVGRFARKDLGSRRAIAGHSGAPPELIDQLNEDFADIGDGPSASR